MRLRSRIGASGGTRRLRRRTPLRASLPDRPTAGQLNASRRAGRWRACDAEACERPVVALRGVLRIVGSQASAPKLRNPPHGKLNPGRNGPKVGRLLGQTRPKVAPVRCRRRGCRPNWDAKHDERVPSARAQGATACRASVLAPHVALLMDVGPSPPREQE